MRVIKLGGSLYGTAELSEWLQKLYEISQHETLLLVPGGGPFADQVRSAQQRHGISDKAAHHMAILAMAQFGLLLMDRLAESKAFYYPPSKQQLGNGLYIWLPNQALVAVDGLDHSWDITSDSLALWLAQQLHADELVLIKRAAIVAEDLAGLTQHNIIDNGFSTRYQARPLPVRLFHYQQHSQFPTHGKALR